MITGTQYESGNKTVFIRCFSKKKKELTVCAKLCSVLCKILGTKYSVLGGANFWIALKSCHWFF